jgi:DNA-directed RNA polymerase delta subunit
MKKKQSTEKAGSALALLATLLEHLPERTREILVRRYGVLDGRARTLEEIGKEYRITRERVRQVVGNALGTLADHENDSDVQKIMSRVRSTLEEKSGIMKSDELITKLADGDAREKGALMVFLECLPVCGTEKEAPHRHEVCFLNGFLFSEWEEIHNVVVKLLETAAEPLTLDELYERFVKQYSDYSKDRLLHFLLISRGVEQNVFGKWGLAKWSEIKPRGMREKAHLVLKMTKEPLHFREIARLIDEYGLQNGKKKKSHPQTVHNELIKDKRFVLVGRGMYALSDWGYRKGTVREVVEDVLKTAGKPLTRDEILDRVLKVRRVKKSTIVINLNTFFTRVGKNAYMLKGKK